MREEVLLWTALCLEAVVNLTVPNEGWYVPCRSALQGLENVEKWLLLGRSAKELEEGCGERRAGQKDSPHRYLCSCLTGLDIKMSAFVCIVQEILLFNMCFEGIV